MGRGGAGGPWLEEQGPGGGGLVVWPPASLAPRLWLAWPWPGLALTHKAAACAPSSSVALGARLAVTVEEAQRRLT